MHREVDMLVTNASNHLMKTLSIVPPDIYGDATGVGKRTTFLVPEYIKVVMNRKEAFYLGEGQNYRAATHISDVISCWVILLGEAIKGGGQATWGKEVNPLTPHTMMNHFSFNERIGLLLRCRIRGQMERCCGGRD